MMENTGMGRNLQAVTRPQRRQTSNHLCWLGMEPMGYVCTVQYIYIYNTYYVL